INRKGIEIVLTGTPVRTKDIKWDVTVNYSQVHEWVKEYFAGDSIREGIKLGERNDVFRSWDWERTPDGQIVYGSNGFPQYIDHVVNIGHTDPDYIFGITNSLNDKNFGLSFSLNGRIGASCTMGLNKNYTKEECIPEPLTHT